MVMVSWSAFLEVAKVQVDSSSSRIVRSTGTSLRFLSLFLPDRHFV
jgi:hypothetical protein